MFGASISVALCTVFFRRFMDSFSGRTVVPNSTCPNISSLVMFTAALYYLYSHLRNGTLVNIGTKVKEKYDRVSQKMIQKRRCRNSSWFLRDARECRNKCKDAILRLAKQSFECLTGQNIASCVVQNVENNTNTMYKRTENSKQNDTSARTSKTKELLDFNPAKENYCLIYKNQKFNSDTNTVDHSKIVCSKLNANASAILEEPYTTRRNYKNSKFGIKKKKQQLKKITRCTRSGKVYSVIDTII